MKRLICSMMALAMVAISCQREYAISGYEGWDAVTLNLSVGIPELSDTRSGGTGMDSKYGAIDNFDAIYNFDDKYDDKNTGWNKYDLRYIAEVYEIIDSNGTLSSEPIIDRYTRAYDKYDKDDEYSDNKFKLLSVRLAPNRDYRIVIWADFVNQGEDVDLHYNTADLKAITRLSAPTAMDESQDAYFVTEKIHVGNRNLEKDLVLKRPFGKIRVITTDHHEVNNNVTPSKFEVKFYNHKLFSSLNAITGIASGETINEYSYAVTKEESPYTAGYDEAKENMTLFADYILAPDSTYGYHYVNFTLNTYDLKGGLIKSADFNTSIPLGRNKLTTIMGNLLTQKSSISVTVDDNTDDEIFPDVDDDLNN